MGAITSMKVNNGDLDFITVTKKHKRLQLQHMYIVAGSLIYWTKCTTYTVTTARMHVIIIYTCTT